MRPFTDIPNKMIPWMQVIGIEDKSKWEIVFRDSTVFNSVQKLIQESYNSWSYVPKYTNTMRLEI